MMFTILAQHEVYIGCKCSARQFQVTSHKKKIPIESVFCSILNLKYFSVSIWDRFDCHGDKFTSTPAPTIVTDIRIQIQMYIMASMGTSGFSSKW